MTELMAPAFVTPARSVHRPPTVSIVGTGRPLSEGIRLHHNRDRYGFILNKGIEGFNLAPVENTTQPKASGGASLRHRRWAEGDMFMPITLASPSPEGMYDMTARLVDTVTNQGGYFDVVFFDPYSQEPRRRTVLYDSGLETPNEVTPTLHRVGITGTFLSPFWRGPVREVVERIAPPVKPLITADPGDENGEGAYSFPFFPLFLADSTVQGEHELRVEGDSPTWPIWEITGPGRDVEIIGPRGGRLFVEGEVTSPITIVTEPGRRSIRDDSGLIWDRMVPGDDQFFPLVPGQQTIKMTMVGGNPESTIKAIYEERWKTPRGVASGSGTNGGVMGGGA